jgi:hypothetical protein
MDSGLGARDSGLDDFVKLQPDLSGSRVCDRDLDVVRLGFLRRGVEQSGSSLGS